MLTGTNPLHRPLEDNLVMKSIADEDDLERVAQFNGQIHGSSVTGMSRELVRAHPSTHPDQWIYVEDESTSEVVAALCLIPWEWSFDGVTIKAGEQGIVGTAEAYRRRGLIRALNVRFREMLDEGGYHISHIQGIPYYYRQFGYEYAIPLEGGYELRLDQISDDPPQGVTFHAATVDDIPALQAWFDTAMSPLDIAAKRTPAIWRYLLGPSMDTETACDTWIVSHGGEDVGYYRINHEGFGDGLILGEASDLPAEAIDAVLRHAKSLSIERDKPYIRLNLAASHPLMRAALTHGARDAGTYAWQLMIPDPARLLDALGPVFETRLASSPFANLTREVVVNLYRRAYQMTFTDGQLTSVESIGFRDGDSTISLPPNAFTQLAVGHRSLGDLRNIYPDVGCWGESRHLIDTLFPKLSSFLHMPY